MFVCRSNEENAKTGLLMMVLSLIYMNNNVIQDSKYSNGGCAINKHLFLDKFYGSSSMCIASHKCPVLLERLDQRKLDCDNNKIWWRWENLVSIDIGVSGLLYHTLKKVGVDFEWVYVEMYTGGLWNEFCTGISSLIFANSHTIVSFNS